MIFLIDKIKIWLKLTSVPDELDLNSNSVIEIHSKIIQQKHFLKKTYYYFYQQLLSTIGNNTKKNIVEIGSGAGFIKEINSHVITSDIILNEKTDVCFSGENMPFQDNSVDAFIMLNVFHHVKDPIRFLKEMVRCLIPNGKIIMVEPANTLFSRFIYKNFHKEPFKEDGGWSVQGARPLSDSNQALPWIVFFRDRNRFIKEFPQLKIQKIFLHTPLRYSISGGFSAKQLLPNFFYYPIYFLEIVFCPFNFLTAMFMTVELELKTSSLNYLNK